jgi:hypothetical protein
MKKIPFILITLLLLTFFPLPSSAQDNQAVAPLQTITFQDGTTVKGRLIGINSDSYTIETKSLGKINVRASDIKSITADLGTSAPSLATPTQTITANQGPAAGQMAQMQQQLLQDPQINANIQGILQDAEIMNLLKDEKLMQAVLTRDPQQLQNNPNVQLLMQNPKMQSLMEQVRQKIAPQQPSQ